MYSIPFKKSLSQINLEILKNRRSLPDTYLLFFENTQLSPSPTVNILGLSFTHNLNWKSHISSITK